MSSWQERRDERNSYWLIKTEPSWLSVGTHPHPTLPRDDAPHGCRVFRFLRWPSLNVHALLAYLDLPADHITAIRPLQRSKVLGGHFHFVELCLTVPRSTNCSPVIA